MTERFWQKWYKNSEKRDFKKPDRKYKRGQMKSEWGQAVLHYHIHRPLLKKQQQEGHRTLFLLQTKGGPQAAAAKQHNPSSQLFVFL